MDKLKKLVKKYRLFLACLLALLIIYIISPQTGEKATLSVWKNLKEMLSLLPPIFLLIGLVDVWIPKETMVKYLGSHAGIKGVIIAFFFGSFAAGPLYVAFPVAVTLREKGCSFGNMMIFLGAWSTTKLPMLLYESSYMGVRYALIRLLINIVGIMIIAHFMSIILKSELQE